MIYKAAFHFKDQDGKEMITTTAFDYFVDIVQLFDIFFTFFTAIRTRELSEWTQSYRRKSICEFENDIEGIILRKFQETEWCFNNKILAREYLTSYFIFDCLSVIPSLAVNKIYGGVRLFRLFRFLRIQRVMEFIDNFASFNKRFDKENHLFVWNGTLILKTIYHLTFIIHCFACLWILLDSTTEESSDGWLTKFELTDKSHFHIYVHAFELITATFTTMGYGNVYPSSLQEKGCMILVIVIGLVVFALI